MTSATEAETIYPPGMPSPTDKVNIYACENDPSGESNWYLYHNLAGTGKATTKKIGSQNIEKEEFIIVPANDTPNAFNVTHIDTTTQEITYMSSDPSNFINFVNQPDPTCSFLLTEITEGSDNYYEITLASNSALYLTVPLVSTERTNVQTQAKSTTNTQKWKFKKVGATDEI